MRVSATLIDYMVYPIFKVVLPSHMRVSATCFPYEYWSDSQSCPTLSYEGVCNFNRAERLIGVGSCPTLSYEGVCNDMLEFKAIQWYGCPTLSYEGVCNSRGGAPENRIRRCPTLSYEGVCNVTPRKKGNSFLVVLPSHMRVSATERNDPVNR